MSAISAPPPFSPALAEKVQKLLARRQAVQLGSLSFTSPFLLAPMAAIGNAPFRLLMEDLGAGGTVSELISADGIFYKNQRTQDMLTIDPREKNVGLQIFGEDPAHMCEAAQVAEGRGARFVDINMGCPVKKVVTKGGGAALLREPQKLYQYLSTLKKAITIPLTIKIRTGWCADEVNAHETIAVAADCGVEMVAIHGRTRMQQYTGQADWDYIETRAQHSPLPIIGNGDLHTAELVLERWQKTSCAALMIARGCLRRPFIFLESLLTPSEIANAHGQSPFLPQDYWEIIARLYHYIQDFFPDERQHLVQIKKLIAWYAAGLPHAAKFRESALNMQKSADLMQVTQEYFLSLPSIGKILNPQEQFMTSGHG